VATNVGTADLIIAALARAEELDDSVDPRGSFAG
jgi:hypothetical protein